MKNKKNKTVEYGKYGMIFLVPFFVTFLVFQFYPLLYTIFKSFVYDQKFGRNKVVQVIGLGNYMNYAFGGGGEVWKAILVTLVIWILNFIPQILLSLLLAAWFTDSRNKLKGQGAYKVIMYMPNIITAATIAVLFYSLFDVQGSITSILVKLGWAKDGNIMSRGFSALFVISFILFWMWYGNTMVVLIAGILGINPALYEAAMVDGANSRQQFFSITIPLLKPILQFTLVTSAIGGLQMYDIPQLFNNNKPGAPLVTIGTQSVESTKTIVMLIKQYVSAGASQNYGRAATYSVILFILTLAVSLVFYKLTSEKN